MRVLALVSLSAVLLSGQQKKAAEKPKPTDPVTPFAGTINTYTFKMPEPEATLDEPVRKDGRIIYTLSLKDDWSCAPMSNWTPNGYTEGVVTAIQLVCVKRPPSPEPPTTGENHHGNK